MKIEFQNMTLAHLPLLHKWLNEPHVVERWHSEATIDEVRAEYFEANAEAEPDDANEHIERIDRWIVYVASEPVGYVQRYWTAQSSDGWWEDQRDPGTVGIDFFIGEANRIGQGLGTQIISACVDMLMSDPRVTKVISDPSPLNPRSIRCLEKAGFKNVGEIVTPDGPAMLMEVRR